VSEVSGPHTGGKPRHLAEPDRTPPDESGPVPAGEPFMIRASEAGGDLTDDELEARMRGKLDRLFKRPAPPVPDGAPHAPSTVAAGLPPNSASDTDSRPTPSSTGPRHRRPRPGPLVAPGIATERGRHAASPHGRVGPASQELQLHRFLKATEPQPGDDEKHTRSRNRKRDKERGRQRTARTLIRLAVVVAIAAAAAVVLRVFIVAPYYIPSESMEPTLHGCQGCDNDHVLVDKISYRLHSVHQSDIVVFHRPPDASQIKEDVLIKRVIGLPGQTVSLSGGHVLIDGRQLPEGYVNTKCGAHPTQPITGTTSWTVPKGDVFVMGDNRCQSDDSRDFGPIAQSSIIGRAFMIIWPFSRIGFL
jgi:signal peptidase I